jgi:hypothetical protein
VDLIWAALITALITFCLVMAFVKTYNKGYEAGASMVLEEWKKTLRDRGDGEND